VYGDLWAGPQHRAGDPLSSHVARRLHGDELRFAVKTHDTVPNERLHSERSNELDVGVRDEHNIILGRGQLDDLLHDPATHTWEQPPQIDCEITER
jgi:hypothetical protein